MLISKVYQFSPSVLEYAQADLENVRDVLVLMAREPVLPKRSYF